MLDKIKHSILRFLFRNMGRLAERWRKKAPHGIERSWVSFTWEPRNPYRIKDDRKAGRKRACEYAPGDSLTMWEIYSCCNFDTVKVTAVRPTFLGLCVVISWEGEEMLAARWERI